MAVETGRNREDGAAADAADADAAESDAGAGDADRNQVAVHFADGTVAAYAVVVRRRDDDWLYAERLVGDGDGLDDEEVESINAERVRRIRSACVHHGEAGVVHHGAGLFVDPEALLAEHRAAD
jgi:hypothetical protein